MTRHLIPAFLITDILIHRGTRVKRPIKRSVKVPERIADGVQQMIELKLQIAIGTQYLAAVVGDSGPAAVVAAGGGLDQWPRPGAVHRIQQHPRPPIAETQSPRR